MKAESEFAFENFNPGTFGDCTDILKAISEGVSHFFFGASTF
jgi:hypothetical protein